MDIETSLTPIEQAVLIAGGQTALAKSISASHPNVKQQHIWKWLKSKRVPGEYAIAIEEATGGKVSRYRLRSDVFGTEPPPQQSTQQVA